jgi:hypothetical protein
VLQQRILELFKWYDTKEYKTYMAPYFAMVQSSGMGKTRLLMELKRSNEKKISDTKKKKKKNSTSTPEQYVTILCHLKDHDSDEEYYDATTMMMNTIQQLRFVAYDGGYGPVEIRRLLPSWPVRPYN